MTTRSIHTATTPLWVASWVIAACCVWNSTPGLGWLDAGDFATAATSLGVPHPTGFPVLTQLLNLFGLLPAGSVGGRTAWLSGAATGAAVGLLISALFRARIAKVVPLAIIVAAAAVNGFATLNIHARTTEVYALSLLLGAATLRLVAAADDRQTAPDLRLTALLGVALGLGFAHHALFRLWAPAVVVVHLSQLPRESRARAFGIGALAAAVAGLANLYLVAAALRGGMHNWGDPSTLTGLLRVLAGSEIREAFSAEMGTTAGLAAHLGEAARQLGGYPLFLGASFTVHIGWLRSQDERAAPVAALHLALLMVLVEVAYALLLNPMGLRDLQNLQWTALLLPLLALAWLARGWNDGAMPRWILPALTVAFVATRWSPTDDRADGMGGDWMSQDLGLIALDTAPAEAVLLPASDTLIASTLFVRAVGDARPDSYLIGRSQLSRGDSFAYIDARQPFSLAGPQHAPGDVADLRPRIAAMMQVASASNHPVLWERLTRDPDLPPAATLADCWPLAFAAPGMRCSEMRTLSESPTMDVGYAYAARVAAGAQLAPYRAWLAEQHGARGSDAARGGDWRRALLSFGAAATLSPSSSRLSNLAVALANIGRTTEAFQALDAAWPLYPRSTKLCGNATSFPDATQAVKDLWAARCAD